jgi:hypothetical protein
MSVCRQYFNYKSVGSRGIPRITLMGTVAGWRLLWENADDLRQPAPGKATHAESGHLAVWLAALLPALDHSVAAA